MKDPFEREDQSEIVIGRVERIVNLPIVHGKYVEVWYINGKTSYVYQIVNYENGSCGVHVYRVEIGKDNYLHVQKECFLNPDNERSLNRVGVGIHYQNLKGIKNNPWFPDELRSSLEVTIRALEKVFALKEQEYRESRAILAC